MRKKNMIILMNKDILKVYQKMKEKKEKKS